MQTSTLLTIDYAAHAGIRHSVAPGDERIIRYSKYAITAIVLVPFVAGALAIFALLLDVPSPLQ